MLAFFNQNEEQYLQRVYEEYMALEIVAEFIDGTVMGIACPSEKYSNRSTVYNEHNRNYALKFQAITTNGLFANL